MCARAFVAIHAHVDTSSSVSEINCVGWAEQKPANVAMVFEPTRISRDQLRCPLLSSYGTCMLPASCTEAAGESCRRFNDQKLGFTLYVLPSRVRAVHFHATLTTIPSLRLPTCKSRNSSRASSTTVSTHWLQATAQLSSAKGKKRLVVDDTAEARLG